MKFYSQTDPEGLWKNIWIGLDKGDLQTIQEGGVILNTFSGKEVPTMRIEIGPKDSLEKIMEKINEKYNATSEGKIPEDDLV